MESRVAKRQFQESELIELPVTQYLIGIPQPNKHCVFGNFDFSEQSPDIIYALNLFFNGYLDKNGIFFYGSFGVGKTHLMVALYKVMAYRYHGDGIVYFTTFANLVKDVLEDKSFLNYVCGYKYLFLDDITAHKLSEPELDILRTIFTCFYEKGQSLILSGNYPPDSLDRVNIQPHLISRLYDMCYSLKIVGEDHRVRN